jgi:hypothetical protein
MNRLDVYTAVHKMQRARLFDLTVTAGRTDPSDELTIARLAGAVGALVGELTSNAEHEERFIHPLLRAKAPTLTAALDAAHVELDGRLDHLQRVASSQQMPEVDPNALYRALASFTALYIEHLAVEEGEVLPILWEHCSDQELLGILTSFRGSRSPLENLASLLAQLPTLNPAELTQMASLGVDSAELPALAELLATILQPAQLGGLQSVLAR